MRFQSWTQMYTLWFIPVGVSALTLVTWMPRCCLPPHPVLFSCLMVSVRIVRRQKVPIQFCEKIWVVHCILKEFIEHPGSHGWGDPLPGVDTAVDPHCRLVTTAIHANLVITVNELKECQSLSICQVTLSSIFGYVLSWVSLSFLLTYVGKTEPKILCCRAQVQVRKVRNWPEPYSIFGFHPPPSTTNTTNFFLGY